MAFEVRIPNLGESVTEGVIVRWAKKDGEPVKLHDVLLELETDKASLELPAERAGVLRILKREGETVGVGEVVARIEDGATAGVDRPPPGPAARAVKSVPEPIAEPAPEAASEQDTVVAPGRAVGPLSPSVRRLITEHQLDPAAIRPSGRGGRLTKEDVLAHLEQGTGAPAEASAPVAPPAAEATPAEEVVPEAQAVARAAPRVPPAPAPALADGEERVPMSRIRKRIAERLVQAQRTAAILTTFNEVDMSAVLAVRAAHKERFQQVHGVSLGFMSFFAHASISALREFPALNAEIRGDDIVYKHYVHLGIAVGTDKGLVVPVVHHADRMSFAGIEREIERLARLAREGKLTLDDLSGGTFTISNGGVYGSLLSTPILNPPQSGILGMHKIEKRPVAVNDQVAIRPMMYLALSYDHRLVDGEQAVSFLVCVKERLEDPARLLLDV